MKLQPNALIEPYKSIYIVCRQQRCIATKNMYRRTYSMQTSTNAYNYLRSQRLSITSEEARFQALSSKFLEDSCDFGMGYRAVFDWLPQ